MPSAACALLDKVGWAEPSAPAGVPANSEPVDITMQIKALLAVQAFAEELSTARDQATDLALSDPGEIREANAFVDRVLRLFTDAQAAATSAGPPRQGGDDARSKSTFPAG